MTRENSIETAKSRILAAALPHVPFDGWSQITLRAAIADSGVAAAMGAGLFPRGGIDLAIAYHKGGDRDLADALAQADLTQLRYQKRVTHALRLRLQLVDKEIVRKGAALFALPQHSVEGAALIWGTSDCIWTALNDTSRDINWYSKRATLSAVYAATVLFWLGDTSADDSETWQFLDRRIENVMQFEKIKASFGGNRIGKTLAAGPLKVLERITAPNRLNGLPGRVND